MATSVLPTISTQAWFPDRCLIKLERLDGSGLIQNITTEVTNFSESGGEKNSESIAHFGGAFLTIQKPQEQYQVSFDMDITDTTAEQLLSNDITGIGSSTTGSATKVVSGGNQDFFKIKLEWRNNTNSGSEGFKIIYYNAIAVSVTKDNSADDRLTGTVTFNMPPADSNGSGQRYLIDCSNLANGGIGSTVTGSYGSWEKTADSLFGYAPGSMLF